jgi:hypothetical protein
MTISTGTFCLNPKADADESNLAPLAKFVARQQLEAFFVCKTRKLPAVRQQASELRRRRIEGAHRFQKASDVAAPHNRTVSLTNRGPSLIVVSTFSKCAILAFIQFDTVFARLPYP